MGEYTQFGFGRALDLLNAGRRVARSGWNGKGLFLQMVEAREWTYTAAAEYHGKKWDNFPLRPFIGLKAADGSFGVWSPTNNDVLASDWYVLEP